MGLPAFKKHLSMTVSYQETGRLRSKIDQAGLPVMPMRLLLDRPAELVGIHNGDGSK